MALLMAARRVELATLEEEGRTRFEKRLGSPVKRDLTNLDRKAFPGITHIEPDFSGGMTMWRGKEISGQELAARRKKRKSSR